MHFLHMCFDNARKGGRGELSICRSGDEIAKWTTLDDGPRGLELLRLISVACGGTSVIPHLDFDIRALCRDPGSPLQVELVLALHLPYEAPTYEQGPMTTGIRTNSRGEVTALKSKDFILLSPQGPLRKAKTGLGSSSFFLLGYGPYATCHEGTDDFDFGDPYFRHTRLHSLFADGAQLTDPVEFLTRLHYRAVRCKRVATGHALRRLASLLQEQMGIDCSCWLERQCDFRREWARLSTMQQRAGAIALDAVRHLLDAYPRDIAPLDTPALILLDRPNLCCTEQVFPHWANLMDLLLPRTQFLVTLNQRSQRRLPPTLLAGTCRVPVPAERPRKPLARLRRGAVLLLDLDGRLPNLALMKLSRCFKDQGRKVVLARHEAYVTGVESVYGSAVFSTPSTLNRLARLRRYYGDSLIAGGSGIDIKLRLPAAVESLPADYDLYPELGDRAIGFLTRGCPFHCPFCLVPIKEGDVRQVSDLDDLLMGGRLKLILLDDNILAHPKAKVFLEEMTRRGLPVNFNQQLDLHLVDSEVARLLLRVQCSNVRFTRHVFHFALNGNRDLEELRGKYQMFGFTSRDNVEFVCMYGFNTTLAQDVERFRFLRSLPGAYVFVQPYRPVPGGVPADVENFFDEHADNLLDDLIRIVFPQNMKSMENYYRWVSRMYAQTFGRPHMGLVDTIFRYNHRERRGYYLATLCDRNRRALPALGDPRRLSRLGQQLVRVKRGSNSLDLAQ
ncbi:MAG: hypothetical protein ABSH28_13610 [Acidobacteriota bacterium]|jgi:hypothetical protein